MGLVFEQRESDSPYVERIWRSWSENISTFTSIAVAQWHLVIWKELGQTFLSLQGPETEATSAPVPEDAEFIGILFKTGSFMPTFPVSQLVNSHLLLPRALGNSFWLEGSAWEVPTYENAECFVTRLVQKEVLVYEPLVGDVLNGYQPKLSMRSVQRRFLQATGLTHSMIQQIDRARHATTLLQLNVSILDTVHEAGYFDQPHLTRSLKNFIGYTPAQLLDRDKPEQLSFLCNTSAL